MGYSTSYSLEIIDRGQEPDNIIELLTTECEDARYAIDDEGNGQESCRWYEHEDDMKKFSAKYPTAVLCLSGYGDEQEDMWKEYYHDGKSQRCNAIITYDPFDKSKLQ